MAAPLPQDFGPYCLQRRLGVGGMAETFVAVRKASHEVQQRVCLKRVLPAFNDDPEFILQFQREGRLAARLRHQNVVGVIDIGEVDGVQFIALELVDGMDLRALSRRQRLPEGLIVYVAQQLAFALDHAHTHEGGIVHRDISPANVLISNQGEVKLADFGVAKAISGATVATASGIVKGKVPYMAPEQMRGGKVDARADLYSLGVLLFELLAGRRPFVGSHDVEIMMKVLEGNRPTLQSLVPDASPGLISTIEMLLHREPDARIGSAAVLLERLDALEHSERAEATLAALVRQAAGENTDTEREVAPPGDAPKPTETLLHGARVEVPTHDTALLPRPVAQAGEPVEEKHDPRASWTSKAVPRERAPTVQAFPPAPESTGADGGDGDASASVHGDDSGTVDLAPVGRRPPDDRVPKTEILRRPGEKPRRPQKTPATKVAKRRVPPGVMSVPQEQETLSDAGAGLLASQNTGNSTPARVSSAAPALPSEVAPVPQQPRRPSPWLLVAIVLVGVFGGAALALQNPGRATDGDDSQEPVFAAAAGPTERDGISDPERDRGSSSQGHGEEASSRGAPSEAQRADVESINAQPADPRGDSAERPVAHGAGAPEVAPPPGVTASERGEDATGSAGRRPSSGRSRSHGSASPGVATQDTATPSTAPNSAAPGLGVQPTSMEQNAQGENRLEDPAGDGTTMEPETSREENERESTALAVVPADAPEQEPSISDEPTSVRVTVVPWGEVWLGERYMGRAPVVLRLPPGRHVIHAGYERPIAHRTLRVRPGSRGRRIEFELPE